MKIYFLREQFWKCIFENVLWKCIKKKKNRNIFSEQGISKIYSLGNNFKKLILKCIFWGRNFENIFFEKAILKIYFYNLLIKT